ncbi:MAG: hypothetical protein A4E66_02719 [Syntrophus sp. PtaB.Bin001]|nr:MAG: hypothetical protein A4E66_02719 [Syntrophus sp. PtaB.Bin001]
MLAFVKHPHAGPDGELSQFNGFLRRETPAGRAGGEYMKKGRSPEGQRLLHFLKEVLWVCRTGSRHIGRAVGGDNSVDVLLHISLSCGSRCRAGAQRSSAGALHAGIAVCLVVVTDIEKISSPFKGAGQRLDADVERAAVARVYDYMGIFAYCAEGIRHS